MPTLIQETGTGLANANSYATVSYANEYFAERGETDWKGTNEKLTQALLVGFQSLEALYGPDYLGSVDPNSAQAALFPRPAFYDALGRYMSGQAIPVAVIRAQCEIALLYLQDVNVFPQRSTEQNIANQSVKIGELATATQYSKAVEGESFPGFRKVDLAIAPVVRGHKPIAYRLGL